MSEIPEFETLEEVRLFLRENWGKGVNCPCCRQRVQLYKPKLYSTQCVCLINLNRERLAGNEWVHVDKFDYYNTEGKGRARGHNFSEIRYWGLIEQQPASEDSKTRTSGCWRITQKGIDFVNGKITVQERIRVFNATFYGFEGKQITIKEAMGNKFDYNELMGFIS